MKITLAITIYNKEKWVKSILESWIQNVSNKEKLEVVIVFDDLKDASEKIARQYLEEVNVAYKFLYLISSWIHRSPKLNRFYKVDFIYLNNSAYLCY